MFRLPEDQEIGYNVVIKSLSAPFEKICENMDLPSQVLSEKVIKSKDGRGLDLKSRAVVDLYEAGVIDPVRVTISAVKNSVSVVSTLITTNNAIVEV